MLILGQKSYFLGPTKKDKALPSESIGPQCVNCLISNINYFGYDCKHNNEDYFFPSPLA